MAAEKRSYTRRSDEERIVELERKLEGMKHRVSQKRRADSPVLRDIPRVQRRLQRFVQLAMDHDREDLANSTMAFMAGLDRVLRDTAPSRRRGRRASTEDEEES